jgi:hypothetical protein
VTTVAGRVRPLAHLAQYVHAVHIGQLQVQQHAIDGLIAQQGQGLFAVLGHQNAVAQRLELHLAGLRQ